MEKDISTKPNPIKYIKQALEVLDGTFALSIVDSDTGEIYLARVGSILYYNTTGAFSTLSGEGFKEVPEGTILRLNKNTKRFNKVGSFKYSSPFMFI
jgi:glucosamine 6-phosphate synthetase-like amidotransferase/phosphosugar isomerase protein